MIDKEKIVSPAFVNAVYATKFAQTPEIGLTSANSALNSFFANSIAKSSTLSM